MGAANMAVATRVRRLTMVNDEPDLNTRVWKLKIVCDIDNVEKDSVISRAGHLLIRSKSSSIIYLSLSV